VVFQQGACGDTMRAVFKLETGVYARTGFFTYSPTG
jgi:hypothetical protein